MYAGKKKQTKHPEAPIDHSSYVAGNIKVNEVPGHKKLRLLTFVGSSHTQVFSVRFSNDDSMLVSGSIDGDVTVYDVYESKTLTLAKSWKRETLPTTGIRWRPTKGGQDGQHFVTTCADGSLTWFDKTGDVLHRESSNHALLCCDYSPLGDFVVVGRDDFAVCVYDEETKKATHVHRPFIQVYEGATEMDDNGGHSNRVFSIKCITDKPNVFISGGWDSKIRVWDVREKNCVRGFYGPHISGDSIDYKKGQVLTGSYRNQEILQLWDFASGELVKTLKVDTKEHDAAYCYSAQFGKGQSGVLGMGMTGCNQVQLYDSKKNYELCGQIQMQAPCYTIDFSNNGKMMACSGAEGIVYLFALE